MEIIDAHAHIYPTKIAKKATDAIGQFYDIKMELEQGISEILIEKGKKSNVNRFLVHSCATKKEQVRSINSFIYDEITKHKEFIGFMTLHQGLSIDEMIQEINICLSQGFKGIKLHPDFQKFNIDGEDADKIYQAVIQTNCNFPILFHTGDDRYDYSSPVRLSRVAKKYPNINFIGAHFGGYRCWDKVDVYEGLENIYFDTSSSLMFISKDKALSLINKFGVDKFFFGDDFPMWDIQDELKRFFSLGLKDGDNEKILSKNIKKLLNI